MTRPGVTWGLVALNLALAVLLALGWLTPRGTLRGVHWPVPAAIAPQLAADEDLPGPPSASVNGSLGMLERPLFSPSRRPPPLTAVQDAPTEEDPLADIQLQGVYTGSGGGGIFAKVNGKNQRIPLGGSLGGWVVKSITDREVALARGAQTHTLRLAPAKLSRLAPTPAAAKAVAPGNPAPEPASAPARSQADNPAARQEQERQERQRARLKLMNERRIANGLPPVTQ